MSVINLQTTVLAETVGHPLDPLSASEIRQTVALLRASGKVTPGTRFVSISLKEPLKASVHALAEETSLPREALAVLFDNDANSCFEAEVSITGGDLLAWKHVPGVQPTMTIEEQVECEQAMLASEEFRAALKRHCGVDDASVVMVDIWSAGNYGSQEDRTQRLARPLCFAS